MRKQFIEHRPGYFTGFENITYEVKDFKEVLDIPFVKNFSDNPDFYSYAVSVDTKPEYKMRLMALYDWNEDFNGCTRRWCVGQLPGFIMYETNLQQYENLMAGHKPNCWIRKYKGNIEMFGSGRSDESRMKILKELGWPREDQFGIACYCDCGFKEK